MKRKKVRIGGWVDAELKIQFLRHCNSGRGRKGTGDGVSQSQLLETLLAEGLQRLEEQKSERDGP